MVLQANGAIKFATDNGYSFYQTISEPTTVFDGAWHLVVAVRNGATLSIYLDGELLQGTSSGGGTSTLDVSNNLALLIGSVQQIQEPLIHYSGAISNVKLWGRDLQQSEMKDGSIVGTNGNETDMVAYWPLQQNGEDLSVTQNNVVAIGDAIFTVS